MTSIPPYSGPRRRLVLAFDVGTTVSGTSYSILVPGEIPEIRGVTRYPEHEHISGASKIPTVIYYNKKGNIHAVGAEAMREGIADEAEEDGWTKVERFTLHLHPKTQSAVAHTTQEIPPLPEGKTVLEVFADFLRYLHKCARSYIEDTHANGVNLWKSVQDNVHYVLTYRNAWGAGHRSLLRKIAVMAGLIPNSESGQNRLFLISEGEANLHFCIANANIAQLRSRNGVVVVDAGKDTVDVSAYKYVGGGTGCCVELTAPQCHFRASISVLNNARTYFENFLNDSRWADDVPHILRCFEKTTMLRFRSADEFQYVKFGSTRGKDPKYNIRFGQLQLSGTDVASFFEPYVQCIIEAVGEHFFLVGRFIENDWIYRRLKEEFSTRGLNACRPESYPSKALTDGCILSYIQHFLHIEPVNVPPANLRVPG